MGAMRLQLTFPGLFVSFLVGYLLRCLRFAEYTAHFPYICEFYIPFNVLWLTCPENIHPNCELYYPPSPEPRTVFVLYSPECEGICI